MSNRSYWLTVQARFIKVGPWALDRPWLGPTVRAQTSTSILLSVRFCLSQSVPLDLFSWRSACVFSALPCQTSTVVRGSSWVWLAQIGFLSRAWAGDGFEYLTSAGTPIYQQKLRVRFRSFRDRRQVEYSRVTNQPFHKLRQHID